MPAPDAMVLVDATPWPGPGIPSDIDIDLFLVRVDLRALGKWEGVADADVAARVDHLADLGLRSRVVAGPSTGRTVVFFAKSESTLDEAEALERAYRNTRSFADRAPSSREFGRLLGYAPCCVEAWATGPQDDAAAIARLGASLAQSAPALMNFFPRAFSALGFLPCALACEAARLHSEQVANALDAHGVVRREALERALRGVVLWLSGPYYVIFQGISKREAHGFSYESVVTTVDVVGFPDIPEERDMIERVRTMASAFRKGCTIRLEDGEVISKSSAGDVVHSEGPALSTRFVVFDG